MKNYHRMHAVRDIGYLLPQLYQSTPFFSSQVDLYAGAIFIHEALKWQLYPSVIILLAITAIYTIGGR